MNQYILKSAAIKGIMNLVDTQPEIEGIHEAAVEFIYNICVADKMDLPDSEE